MDVLTAFFSCIKHLQSRFLEEFDLNVCLLAVFFVFLAFVAALGPDDHTVHVLQVDKTRGAPQRLFFPRSHRAFFLQFALSFYFILLLGNHQVSANGTFDTKHELCATQTKSA